MDVREENAPRRPLLATLIPIVSLVGLLGYMGYILTREGDAASFYLMGAAIALFVYVLTFTNVALGLAILIACIGLSPELSMGGISNLRLEDFLVPALAAAWLARAMRAHESLADCRVRRPMLAYLVSMIVSSILGAAVGSTKAIEAILYLGKYVEYFLIFIIVVNNVKTEREFKALVLFSLMIGIAAGLMGVSQVDNLRESLKGRMTGPLGETATIFGGYLLLNLSLALGFFLNAPTPGPRVAGAATASLLTIVSLYTFSRTTYAAMAAGLSLFALLKNRRLFAIVLILLVTFPFLAPEGIWERASTIGTVFTERGTPSWVARVTAWQIGFNTHIMKSPLLGSGLASVALGDVDNEYVRVACDLGLLGLAAFLWWLARLGLEANRLYGMLPENGFFKGFAAGYIIGFFSLAVHAIGATSLTSIRIMEQFMLLSGFMVCLANNREVWVTGDVLRIHPWEEEIPLPRAG
jgi:hypothetical protein